MTNKVKNYFWHDYLESILPYFLVLFAGLKFGLVVFVYGYYDCEVEVWKPRRPYVRGGRRQRGRN